MTLPAGTQSMHDDPDLLAVVEFRYAPGEVNGWSVQVTAAEWMRTGAVGRLLREAADRYDPPHPLLDLTAEHHPECTCPRCAGPARRGTVRQ